MIHFELNVETDFWFI